MELFITILRETWGTIALSAPYLLLGLGAAGLIHEFLPKKRVEAWMGGEGPASILRASAFGVPLPVCSCGVVPLAIELRRKGASRPASTAFLITTPESGADSIALTWGLLGPAMAIARPLASLVTATATGLATAFVFRNEAGDAAAAGDATVQEPAAACCSNKKPEAESVSAPPPPWFRRLIAAVRYGYLTLLNDIAAWLLFGFVLTGLISALVPPDLAQWGLAGGWLPMLLLLAVSVPMYLCASASTPVAAALVAKGLSPGAALVFLLAGPATNAASISVLTATFGKKWLKIYLSGIVLGSLACGWLFDLILVAGGWQVISRVTAECHAAATTWQWVTGALLLSLTVGLLVRGRISARAA